MPFKSKSIANTMQSLSFKIYLIIYMNLTDGIATYIGVNYFEVTELNKIMVNIVTDIKKLIIFKILIPTLLLFFILDKAKSNEVKESKICTLLINICFFVYLIAIIFHIIWLTTTIIMV